MSTVLRKKTASNEPGFIPDARRIAHIASDKKAENIIALDLRGLTVVADCFVLLSASSEPQMKAVYSSLREEMKQVGRGPLNTEGTYQHGWVLIDFGDVVVHLFREEAREFYDLDGLWGDAPRIELDLDTAA